MSDTTKPQSETTDSSTHSDKAGVEVTDLTKEYDTQRGHELVFENLDLTIEPGSFVTMIGQSGSGKSTLLKILSGIVSPTSGQYQYVQSDGRPFEDVTLGHVFQDSRLLPWNTCIDNIELVHENNPDYNDELAKKYLDMVNLSDSYHKYATQLSGGQEQRVGIARALSVEPDFLLMDEPFSNLDEITAFQLRDELMDIWVDLRTTVFFVTHDIDEAIQLSDRILMLGRGEVFADVQVPMDRPRDVDSEEFIRFKQEALSKFNEFNEFTELE